MSEGWEQHRRTVKSYVSRAGRLTPAQRRALDELLPIYGIPNGAGEIDVARLFGRQGDTVVEIGFGNGEATWRMAAQEPEVNFIGLEVHPPGVGRLLRVIHEREIDNLRVAMVDAVPFIRERLPGACLAGVRIYFPDPWPKKRHHKRRLVQTEFVALLAAKMKPDAILHLATDWEPYAKHILEVLKASSDFANLSPGGGYSPQPSWRPETKYARRGVRLGHRTRDLLYRRVG